MEGSNGGDTEQAETLGRCRGLTGRGGLRARDDGSGWSESGEGARDVCCVLCVCDGNGDGDEDGRVGSGH